MNFKILGCIHWQREITANTNDWMAADVVAAMMSITLLLLSRRSFVLTICGFFSSKRQLPSTTTES